MFITHMLMVFVCLASYTLQQILMLFNQHWCPVQHRYNNVYDNKLGLTFAKISLFKLSVVKDECYLLDLLIFPFLN